MGSTLALEDPRTYRDRNMVLGLTGTQNASEEDRRSSLSGFLKS